MGSQPRIALALGLLLGIASVTARAGVCDDLSWLLQHAETGFATFDTRFRLEGANTCEVTTGSDAEFECDWEFQDSGQAEDTYQSLLGQVGQCLAPAHTPGKEIVLSGGRSTAFRSDSISAHVTVRLRVSTRRAKVSVHVYE